MTPELTNQEQRAYVEKVWDTPICHSVNGSSRWCVQVYGFGSGFPVLGYGKTRKEAWPAAYAFTVAREREIAELEEEIELVADAANNCFEHHKAAYSRNYDRLTAILADKKKGMRDALSNKGIV
jgi:hypothetical protein